MKTTALSILLCLFSYISLSGQSCSPSLHDQESIDNFHTNYPGCKTLLGGLYLYSDIYNLDGLLGVEEITGGITCVYCQIENLHGLDSLKKIGIDNYINFENCSKLKNLKGLENVITKKFNMYLYGNTALENLEGFPTIDNFLGKIHLSTNANLISLHGFQNAQYIGGLKIDNVGIKDLSGLDNLTSIGDLEITYCDELKSLEGLNNLRNIKNDFTLEDNKSLENLNGLNSLDSVGAWLGIYENPSLKSLIGLDSLKYIGIELAITFNDSLKNLHGLSSLQKVKYLNFESNKSLETLNGLTDTIALSGIWISANQKLTECAIDLFCKHYFIYNPGLVNILTNGPGCSSRPEVEAQCITTSIGEHQGYSQYSIYPNPGTGVYFLNYQGNFKGTITVTDNIGRAISTINNTTIDLTNQPGGIYYFRFNSDKETVIRKAVKY